MKQLFCRIRKEWVAELPEEIVRQNILRHMIEEKEFPPSLLAVEKALKQMPHLSLVDQKLIPQRRIDVVAFAKGIHPHYDLYPLVIVECKAVKLTQKTITQAIGYNHNVGAPYIVLVNQEQLITAWYDPSKKNYQFIHQLPSYSNLIAQQTKT